MRYRHELSVVFEDAKEKECKECEEYPVPDGDNGDKTALHTLVCMEAGEKIAVRFTIEPDFDFRDAEGVRVTIAIGHRPASPDNGQDFWISSAKQDKTTTLTHLFTWTSELAKKACRRRLKAPTPPGKFMLHQRVNIPLMLYLDGGFEHISIDQWEKRGGAPPGSIAVYVTRGRLPGETTPGLKRCKTDPPESMKYVNRCRHL